MGTETEEIEKTEASAIAEAGETTKELVDSDEGSRLQDLLEALREHFQQSQRPGDTPAPGRQLLAERYCYAIWLATPADERNPSKQADLARELGVSEKALWLWKREPQVLAWRDYELRLTGGRKMGDILKAISNKAQSGDVPAARLIIEHAHGRFENEENPAVTINIGPQVIEDDDKAELPSWEAEGFDAE
jgi:hypothetical protein